MPRKDHELSVPELLAKIEKLIGYVRAKDYGEGFEAGRKFECGCEARGEDGE